MNKLVIKRKDSSITDTKSQMMVRINADSYDRILEVANESGESIRSIASKMIDFAFENIIYAENEE